MSPVRRDERQAICMRDEDGIWIALKSGINVGSEILYDVSILELDSHGLTYVHRTYEILVAHQNVGEYDAKDECENPSPDETLDGFLWGQFDELGASKCHAAHVGEDVVRDHKRDREEKPDHALKHVIDNKVCLDHDQV